MQELRQMIAEEVQAALATQSNRAPVSAPRQKPQDKSKAVHSSNAAQRFQPRLSEEQKAEVRGKYAAGAPPEALMEEYGISRATLFRYLQDAETRPARKRQRPRPSAT
jgi:DNA invertase Pin-like site-specific DNA recombinase